MLCLCRLYLRFVSFRKQVLWALWSFQMCFAPSFAWLSPKRTSLEFHELWISRWISLGSNYFQNFSRLCKIVEVLLSEILNGRAFVIFRFLTSPRPVLHFETLQNDKWNVNSVKPKSRQLFEICLNMKNLSMTNRTSWNSREVPLGDNHANESAKRI